jgi:hypothetical protein
MVSAPTRNDHASSFTSEPPCRRSSGSATASAGDDGDFIPDFHVCKSRFGQDDLPRWQILRER